MIITDEIVEAGARAMFEEKHGTAIKWDTAISKDMFRARARAVLQASLPGIVEEIAKVAEQRFPHGHDIKGAHDVPHRAGNAIAAAIRSLSKGEICPRSMNHRPDDFTKAECVAAGECGCGADGRVHIADPQPKAKGDSNG